jgi:hypothetical protein
LQGNTLPVAKHGVSGISHERVSSTLRTPTRFDLITGTRQIRWDPFSVDKVSYAEVPARLVTCNCSRLLDIRLAHDLNDFFQHDEKGRHMWGTCCGGAEALSKSRKCILIPITSQLRAQFQFNLILSIQYGGSRVSYKALYMADRISLHRTE